MQCACNNPSENTVNFAVGFTNCCYEKNTFFFFFVMVGIKQAPLEPLLAFVKVAPHAKNQERPTYLQL